MSRDRQLQEAHSNAHTMLVVPQRGDRGGSLLLVAGDGQRARRGGGSGAPGHREPDPLRISVWSLGTGAPGGPAEASAPPPALLATWGKRQAGAWLWGRSSPSFAGWLIAASPSGAAFCVVVPGGPLQVFQLQVWVIAAPLPAHPRMAYSTGQLRAGWVVIQAYT